MANKLDCDKWFIANSTWSDCANLRGDKVVAVLDLIPFFFPSGFKNIASMSVAANKSVNASSKVVTLTQYIKFNHVL
jgi:hypothetical protein